MTQLKTKLRPFYIGLIPPCSYAHKCKTPFSGCHGHIWSKVVFLIYTNFMKGLKCTAMCVCSHLQRLKVNSINYKKKIPQGEVIKGNWFQNLKFFAQKWQKIIDNFQVFATHFLWVQVKISISILLCILVKLLRGGSVAVDVGISDMRQVTIHTPHETQSLLYADFSSLCKICMQKSVTYTYVLVLKHNV